MSACDEPWGRWFNSNSSEKTRLLLSPQVADSKWHRSSASENDAICYPDSVTHDQQAHPHSLILDLHCPLIVNKTRIADNICSPQKRLCGCACWYWVYCPHDANPSHLSTKNPLTYHLVLLRSENVLYKNAKWIFFCLILDGRYKNKNKIHV